MDNIQTSKILAAASSIFKGRKVRILIVGIELAILIYAYIKADQMNEQPKIE